METRPLGPTGPAVTRLGLGTAALGRPAYLTLGHGEDLAGAQAREPLEARAREVLDAAWDAGIRYLDAARSYGEAERFVRGWLDGRAIPPGAAVVGSKWGYRYVGAWRLDAGTHEVKDHSAAALREQLALSRAVLGPHLALYQIHSATPESDVLGDGEVLDELARLRDAGVRVGVSVSGPAQAVTVRRALAVRRGGEPLFAAVQATWNLLEPSAGPALEAAHQAGVAVLVKEALANGRLGPRGDAPAAGPFQEVARLLGAAPDALALAAALAQPFADVVLLGAATVAQLRSNLAALPLSPRLGADALGVLAPLAEPPEAYWGRRAALSWG